MGRKAAGRMAAIVMAWRVASAGAAAAALLVLASACASGGAGSHTGSGAERGNTARAFDAYRNETVALLRQRRVFQGADEAAELAWNAPREWRPRSVSPGRVPERGILLVHGLGDSPWSFHDVGAQLAERGFLVRTVLLPGHGTRPEDMLDVRFEAWRAIVDEQARTLRGEVGQVYLGGFSTGANLVLEHAYANPDIAGLLLFSPAFASNSTYDWLTPWIGWARPWLLERDGIRPMQNAVRYMTVPTNGFAQYYRSSQRAREVLASGTYGKPVLMVVAEHDSVLDTTYLAHAFGTRFPHPDSRLIWYGVPHAALRADPRVLVRPDRLPEQRISQFSHMGLMFSPRNPLYGAGGSLRICWNGQDEAATAACERGADVWYSDWGYREAGKIHARLTFNPYFEWQSAVMAEVLGEAPGALSMGEGPAPR